MQMETSMKAIGKTIKQMVLENINKKTVLFSKAIGKTIDNMERVKKFGEIKLITKEIFLKGKNKVKEN